MAELKTKPTLVPVKDFLDSIKDDQVRSDSKQIAALMRKATNARPKMWGANIIGFGIRRIKYADRSEREWMQVAFSPRRQVITLYLASGFKGRSDLLAKLGKHRSSKACIHIKRLSDLHLPTLNKLIAASVRHGR